MKEEIREGIQQIGHNWFCSGGYASQTMPNERSFEGDILKYLHSKGCVIKVDRELPTDEDVPEEYNPLACGAEDDSDNIAKAFYETAQQDMLKAGYVAVEDLI